MDIKPGTYSARPIGGLVDKTPTKGTYYVKVEFEIKDTKETLWWTGWLTDKAKASTSKQLAIIGYDNERGTLPDNTIPKDFFASSWVDVAVDEETYESNGTTKTSMRINWINQPFRSTLESGGAKSVLAGLKADMMAARAELGLKRPVGGLKNHAPNAADTDEKIPF